MKTKLILIALLTGIFIYAKPVFEQKSRYKIDANLNLVHGKPTTHLVQKELMFSLGTDGFIKDDALNTTVVENIYNNLAPLQAKYNVVVLINPMLLYKETGYGQGDATIGVNRIHPALRQAFDYFKSKNIGVYIEIYSSDNYPRQNGELGNQPLVKRRYLQTEKLKGLSLDLDCLEDTFAKYDVLKGVRFHELMGTHAIGIAGNNHGFPVDFTLTTEIAQVCKNHNKKLVWGDHDWNFAYTDPTNYGMWLPNLEKACDILGSDITVNFNNNGWGSEIVALQYTRTMANFKNNNKWGYSVQSWWWQEKDAQSLPLWSDGGIRWYLDAYLDMPVELMGAFALETFKRGGNLVQFESESYLFNTPDLVAGQYEQAPDYSGKLNLKRLTDLLLDYETNPTLYPSMNPADYYVNDRGQMMENSWDKKPKTYNQTSLTILGDNVKVFDTYNTNVGKWYNNDKNRYRNWVFDNTIVEATRVKVDFRLIDEMLVVKSKAGQLTAEFYNNISAYYTKSDNLVAATSDGNFVGLTALNLKRNYEGRNNTFYGDPDEIIVARSNGGNIKFTVYEKVFANNGATRQNFVYAVDTVLTSQVNNQLGVIPSSNFIKLLGLRNQNFLFVDNTRPIDNLLIATKTTSNKVQIKGSIGATNINKTVDINASSIMDIKCADANADYVDELAFLLNDNSIAFYNYNVSFDFNYQSNIINVGSNVKKMMATRWTTYYKQGTQLSVNDYHDNNADTTKISPNPTKDLVTIKGLTIGAKIVISDLLGKTIVNSIAKQENEVISTAGFTAGLYIVSVGGNTKLKLVKE
jgi:hypothetical protein